MVAQDGFRFIGKIRDWDNVGHRIVRMEYSEFQMADLYSVTVFKDVAVDAQL